MASILLFPGCLEESPPISCIDDGGCSADQFCGVGNAVCIDRIPLSAPLPDEDDLTLDLEGSPPSFIVVAQFHDGDQQISELIVALPPGATVGDLPLGEVGTCQYIDPTHDVTRDLLATSPFDGCCDADDDSSCDLDEISFTVEDESTVRVEVPGGGDGSLSDNLMDVDGSVEFAFDPGLFDLDEGGLASIVIVGVDETSGDEDDGFAPDPDVTQFTVDIDAEDLLDLAPECDGTLLHGPGTAHVRAADGIHWFEAGGLLSRPGDLPATGSLTLHRLCLEAACRTNDCEGEAQFRVYDVGPGGAPGELVGTSEPFPVVLTAELSKQCVEEAAIPIGDRDQVFVFARWEPTTIGLAPRVKVGGAPEDLYFRATEEADECALDSVPFADLTAPQDIAEIGIGASAVVDVPPSVASSPASAHTSSKPVREVVAAETNHGALGLTAEMEALAAAAASQDIVVMARPLAVASTGTLGVAAPPVKVGAPAFSLTNIVPLDETGTQNGFGYVAQNKLGFVRVSTPIGTGGTIALSTTVEQVSPTAFYWGQDVAHLGNDTFVSGFAASNTPFVFAHDVFKRQPNGTWTSLTRLDSPGGIDADAIYTGCPRGVLIASEDTGELCQVNAVASGISGGACTGFRVQAACFRPDALTGIDYFDLTGAIGPQTRSSESEGFLFQYDGSCDQAAQGNQSRANLGTPSLPAGAFFFVRGFTTADGTGSIDVATFRRQGNGDWVGGGNRPSLEQVRTVANGFPNLAVQHDPGSELFTLCFADVVSGAQRVRCSEWSTRGSADPADWRRLSTFLAPESFNTSSPLAMAGTNIAPRTSRPSLPVTLIGPTISGGTTTIREHSILKPRPCVPGPGVVCLGAEDRFAVVADWRTPQGATGIGTTREVTADSGVATFFSPDNVELFYKSLDACPLPAFQSKWFFLTGLTNVEVVTTLLDTETGQARKYFNPLGRPFQPLLDTRAFVACPVTQPGALTADGSDATAAAPDLGALVAAADWASLPDWALDALATSSREGRLSAPLASRALTCVPSASRLCLNHGRFAVDASFKTPNGNPGVGQPVYLTADTGAFTFFSPDNLEVLVKVLDACASAFDSFWVFAAGLTNVEVTLTVTDTETGAVKQYFNPQNQAFQPVQDTSAFKTCQ